MQVTTKTISFPIRNDEGNVRNLGRIEVTERGTTFTDTLGQKHVVTFVRTTIRHIEPQFEHRALMMKVTTSKIVLNYFLPIEGGVRVLEPHVSGGISISLHDIGNLTDGEAIDFVHRHMNG